MHDRQLSASSQTPHHHCTRKLDSATPSSIMFSLPLHLLPLLLMLLTLLHLFLLHNIAIIIHAAALAIDAVPLGYAVTDIQDAARVEHVGLGLEGLAALGGVDALDEGGEEEDHVAALVHDRGAAVGAADLAGQLVARRALGRVVPRQVVVAVREVDVGLVEDGRPLEGRPVQPLARRAVAVLGRQRFVARQLVPRLAAVAPPVPRRAEGVRGAVDLVWGSVLPVVLVGLRRRRVAVFVGVGGLVGRAGSALLLLLLFLILLVRRHGGECSTCSYAGQGVVCDEVSRNSA